MKWCQKVATSFRLPFSRMKQLCNHEVLDIHASNGVQFQQHPTTREHQQRSWWYRKVLAYVWLFQTDKWRVELMCRSGNRRKHLKQWFPHPETFLRSSSKFHRFPRSHRHSRIYRESGWWCWEPKQARNGILALVIVSVTNTTVKCFYQTNHA